VNRLLVPAAVAALALLLLLHRPPAPAAAITVAPSIAASQDVRKGHPSEGPPSRNVVYVAGAVRHPGLYALPGNARVNDAIVRAGGMLPAADASAINLAEHLTDGIEIRVPLTGEAAPVPARHARSRKTSRRSVPDVAIDVNVADASALASLPGIGETLAARIVEYRGLNGPFASLDELADVAGMTQRRIDAIAPYVRVNAAR
jgi:competence protein ComEA